MTPAEEHRFRELLGRFFAVRGEKLDLLDPSAHRLQLDELVRKCVNARPWEWEEVVSLHFEGLEVAERSGTATRMEQAGLEPRLLAAPLSLELADSFLEKSPRPGLVYRRDLERLPTILLLESEQGRPVPVARAQFLAWDRPPSELFRVALRNTRSGLSFTEDRIDLGDGRAAIAIRSRSQLASASVYFLSRFNGTVGAVGAMFAVPHPRCVLVAPVNGPIQFREVSQLVLAAARRELDAADAAVDVYYWDGKRFYLEAAKITGDPVDGSRKILTGTS